MMKRGFLFIVMALWTFLIFSQKIQKVSAEYTYYAPETMSIEEAKRIALKYAKIQAIADEFGSIVSQSTSLISSDKNGQSDENFFSIADTDIKGEWIETIGDPVYDIQFKDHHIEVTCRVKGKAREITLTKVEFIAKPLRNGTSLKYESNEFRNGDDMYLYFKSPTDGYLIVFLVDENAKNVYSILPYPNDSYSAYEIEANRDYVFFSKKEASEMQKANVIEYNLTCGDSTEINDIIVVFTPSKLQLPKLKTKRIGAQPPSLEYETFIKWRANAMKNDGDLTIKNLTITIQK